MIIAALVDVIEKRDSLVWNSWYTLVTDVQLLCGIIM